VSDTRPGPAWNSPEFYYDLTPCQAKGWGKSASQPGPDERDRQGQMGQGFPSIGAPERIDGSCTYCVKGPMMNRRARRAGGIDRKQAGRSVRPAEGGFRGDKAGSAVSAWGCRQSGCLQWGMGCRFDMDNTNRKLQSRVAPWCWAMTA